MMITTDMESVSRLITNYDIDATAGGLWTDTTHFKVTVPTGKRWKVLGGVINRDANQTVVVDVYNSSNDIILRLDSRSAGTGITEFPSQNYNSYVATGLYIDAGMYIQATFGAAQGAAAYASCLVLEFDN